MSFCSVDGCHSKKGSSVSFFRCPKDEARCQNWKKVLGFIGAHRYASLTSEQCNSRLKICSLHFPEDSLLKNDLHTRLQYGAIPSLNLKTTNNVSCDTCIESERKIYKDVSVLTDREKIKEFRDKASQTTAALSANSPRKKILREEIRELKKVAKSFQSQNDAEIKLEHIYKYLEEHYSEQSCKLLKSQLRLLNKSPRGCRYSDELKQFALSVYFFGPKAYKKISTMFRLPSKSTLNRFTKRWIINPGFNAFIFRLIELRTRLLKEKEKDCIICLQEMFLKSHLFYDISKDKIVGFQEPSNTTEVASKALVVMARGIASNWKQPIAYFFYKSKAASKDIKDILFESVRRLTAIGLNVLGVVSDQGFNFQKLVKIHLKLSEDDVFFFVDNTKLVYFFDVPHLLNCTRDTFFSYSFVLPQGATQKSYLETFYNTDKLKEYSLCPKLTDQHMYPNKYPNIKLKHASQVFSHSVAVALYTYIDFKVLPPDAKATAYFIKIMNHLFDLLNSCQLNKLNAFTGTQEQCQFLDEFENLLNNLTVVSSEGKCMTKRIKFIFGWKLTIKSIKALWETLKSKQYTSLLTRNLNQDCLESVFGQIRNCCGNVGKPTPIQFSRAFKKLFTLKNFDQVDGASCMDDINEFLSNISPDLIANCKEFIVPESIIARKSLKVFTNDYRNLSSTEGNALVDITYYLLKKCLSQHSCNLCVEFKEKNNLEAQATLFSIEKVYVKSEVKSEYSSFDDLTAPSQNVVEYIIQLENIFIDNFNKLACTDSIGTKLRELFKNVTFAHPCESFPFDYFLTLYTRVRIYYTIKFANRDIKDKKLETPNAMLTILKNL